MIFPEIDYSKVDKIRGMNITLVTGAKSDEEGAVAAASFRRSVSVLRQGRKENQETMARNSHMAKARKKPKVCGSPAQPLQGVRAAARFLAEVSDLPVVFSGAGPAGRDTGRPQVELVILPESSRTARVFMNTTDPIADMLTRIATPSGAVTRE